MANTTNFGWETPDDTDLVKDGAAAMRTLGNAIDASFVDLKGGTTGQVLSKASNTDLDYTWVTTDDANAIQNAIVDAKGDLIAASAADTPARLAVGSNGDTLVADSAATTGLRWSSTPSASNPVVNGALDIWQRGTSFSVNATNAYTADRWNMSSDRNITVSRQATGDTTNLPFIQYCSRVLRNNGQGSGYLVAISSLETVNSIPFAGKTVTLSFYARRGSSYSASSNALSVLLISGTGTDQGRQSGGFTGEAYPINSSATLTTTWQRFSFTGTVASTATQLAVYLKEDATGTASDSNDYYEFTGVQIDVGSVALPFRRTGGTLQGELAACERYYWRPSGQSAYAFYGMGVAESGTVASILIPTPVNLRNVATASIDYSNLAVYDASGTLRAVTSMNINHSQSNCLQLLAYVASGLTQYRPAALLNNNSTSAYLAVSSEL